MKFPRTVQAGAGTLLLAACAPAAPTTAAAPVAALAPVVSDVQHGHDVADRNCSLCHAIGPGGASPHPRAPAFGTLGDRIVIGTLRGPLTRGDVVGHQGMPQIELSPRDADDLIAYLESLQPKR